MNEDPHVRARALIDAAHRADPARSPDGQPAELVYADRMEAWVTRLAPNASRLLRLAARCQHLERWLVPRQSFPEGRAGYHAWRRLLYTRQSERARELLLTAGVSSVEAAEVARWVSKTGLMNDPGTQALEDAACLVFLESEIAGFAAKHADYTREKLLGIIRKTWRKMSPAARNAAAALSVEEPVRSLLAEALSSPE